MNESIRLGGSEFWIEGFAVGFESWVDGVFVDDTDDFVREEDIGSAFIHEFLHSFVDFVAFVGVVFYESSIVKGFELGVVEALPVPDADLFGREPDGRPAGVWLHGVSAEYHLELIPIVSVFGAEGPEGAAFILFDFAADSDVGEVGLNDLRGGKSFGLVEECRG